MTRSTYLGPNHLHRFLVDLGFAHNHVDADWCDDGDTENGPHVTGGPAYDEYTQDNLWIIVDDLGQIHIESRGPVPVF